MRAIDRLLGRHSQNLQVTPGGYAIDIAQSYGATGNSETLGHSFSNYATLGYLGNPVIFSLINARLVIFSQARFQFRQVRAGRPGDLFGTSALARLENPWPNGSTADLLAGMEQDVSLAGNAYVYGPKGARYLKRLRPDWVEIVYGSYDDESVDADDLSSELLGYVYTPGGNRPGAERRSVFLLPEEVAHDNPFPDPLAHKRGVSWITAAVREADADSNMTTHKAKFFEHAATPNMLVKLQGVLSPEAFERFKEQLDRRHGSVDNAYRTMILEGGADVQVVGNSFEQMSFTAVQAAGENRLASAAGVPPILAGLKEGLQAATYSNYAQARRAFTDTMIEYLWIQAAQALSTIVDVPDGAELAADKRHIPALKEDGKDAAEIMSSQAASVRQLTDGGFDPDAAVEAVLANDLKMLVGKHGGMFSVQLQTPGADSGGGAAGARELNLVEMVQKVYLGVGVVITADEARKMLNDAGAGLTGPAPTPGATAEKPAAKPAPELPAGDANK